MQSVFFTQWCSNYVDYLTRCFLLSDGCINHIRLIYILQLFLLHYFHKMWCQGANVSSIVPDARVFRKPMDIRTIMYFLILNISTSFFCSFEVSDRKVCKYLWITILTFRCVSQTELFSAINKRKTKPLELVHLIYSLFNLRSRDLIKELP